MADVTPDAGPSQRTGDSGQLILVAGIVVAFALVALVLLLNSVLFAENIATRGVDPSVDRATDHTALAERMGTDVLRLEEAVEHETWTAAEENVSDDIENISNHVSYRRFERHGAHASVNITHTRQGAVLLQHNASRNFTDIAATENWTLATTTGIRNFTMTVNRSETATVSGDRRFNITISGGNGNTWTAWVNKKSGSPSEIQLWLPGRSNPCTSAMPNATINWTAGTFGENCVFTFAEGLDPPYTIEFNNSDNATGSYHIVVSDSVSADDIVTANFDGPGSNTSPRFYPAVYSLVVHVVYQESAVDYETDIRIAPGEPAQTRPIAP